MGLETNSPDLFMFIVCDKMQWTYEQYNSQPDWFIDGLNQLWNLRAKYQKDNGG